MKKFAAVIAAVMMMVCCVSAVADQKALTPEDAKAIALEFFGVKADEAVFTKCKLDRDDGREVYEIEFVSRGVEYDADVEVTTGKIFDTDRDFEDRYDRDDDDDFDDFFGFDFD